VARHIPKRQLDKLHHFSDIQNIYLYRIDGISDATWGHYATFRDGDGDDGHDSRDAATNPTLSAWQHARLSRALLTQGMSAPRLLILLGAMLMVAVIAFDLWSLR
jgi:hypothetical protein